MAQATLSLTGARLDPQQFRFDERSEFDPALVIDVLQGRRLGVIFRDIIPAEAQRAIAAKFWASPGRKHREGEPAHYVGSYHWNKSVGTYLAETAEVIDAVYEVLDVPDSPWRTFRAGLAAELARHGASLRIAEQQGATACPALIRAWDREGEFSLEPHEDVAQCKDPRQAGFEIQHVPEYEVCAVNMCVEHTSGGRLVLWNIRPDNKSRRRLDLDYTGFPYPPESLAEFDELRLDIRKGDIYVFNGRHVHAVDANQGNRSNVSFFIGFANEQTVVTWT
jgi:hypothetical protein